MIAHFCESQDCAWCRETEIQVQLGRLRVENVKLREENARLRDVIIDTQIRGRAIRQPKPGSAYDLPAFALYRIKNNV